MKTRKFSLLEDEYKYLEDGTKVYRIMARSQINGPAGIVYPGQVGGFVEHEKNLDNFTQSWIYDDSVVCGNAYVRGRSAVMWNSVVRDNALVTNNVLIKKSHICDNAVICGYARVSDSLVGNDAVIGNLTRLTKSAVWDKSSIFERDIPFRLTITDCVGKYMFQSPEERVAKYLMIPEDDGLYRIMALRDVETSAGLVKAGDIGGVISGIKNLSQFGNSWIFNGSTVTGNATVQDSAVVKGDSFLTNDVVVCEHATVTNSRLSGRVIVGGSAETNDIDVFGNIRIFSGVKLNKKLIPNRLVYTDKNALNILTTTDFHMKFAKNAEKQK